MFGCSKILEEVALLLKKKKKQTHVADDVLKFKFGGESLLNKKKKKNVSFVRPCRTYSVRSSYVS